jgi:hypothetical protein
MKGAHTNHPKKKQIVDISHGSLVIASLKLSVEMK